jgi:hypothetical protein
MRVAATARKCDSVEGNGNSKPYCNTVGVDWQGPSASDPGRIGAV